MDEDQRGTAAGAPLDYTKSIAGKPEQEGHAVRGHGSRLLLDERRRDVDESAGRPAARAGDLDRDPEEYHDVVLSTYKA